MTTTKSYIETYLDPGGEIRFASLRTGRAQDRHVDKLDHTRTIPFSIRTTAIPI